MLALNRVRATAARCLCPVMAPGRSVGFSRGLLYAASARSRIPARRIGGAGRKYYTMPKIRPATPDDLETIARLHVASWLSAYRGILPDDVLDKLDPADRLLDWSRWFAAPGASTYAAVEHHTFVGFARVLPVGDGVDSPPRAAEISHLYVAPDSQSKGVGQALLARSFEDIVGRGLERAVLWVIEKNYRARAFYERAGFRLDGARRTDPERLGSNAPEVRYQIAMGDALRGR